MCLILESAYVNYGFSLEFFSVVDYFLKLIDEGSIALLLHLL